MISFLLLTAKYQEPVQISPIFKQRHTQYVVLYERMNRFRPAERNNLENWFDMIAYFDHLNSGNYYFDQTLEYVRVTPKDEVHPRHVFIYDLRGSLDSIRNIDIPKSLNLSILDENKMHESALRASRVFFSSLLNGGVQPVNVLLNRVDYSHLDEPLRVYGYDAKVSFQGYDFGPVSPMRITYNSRNAIIESIFNRYTVTAPEAVLGVYSSEEQRVTSAVAACLNLGKIDQVSVTAKDGEYWMNRELLGRRYWTDSPRTQAIGNSDAAFRVSKYSIGNSSFAQQHAVYVDSFSGQVLLLTTNTFGSNIQLRKEPIILSKRQSFPIYNKAGKKLFDASLVPCSAGNLAKHVSASFTVQDGKKFFLARKYGDRYLLGTNWFKLKAKA